MSAITISTDLPAGLSPQALIAVLHNHDAYIKATCPQLISQELVSGDPKSQEPCVYTVTDVKPIGKSTYNLTLINQPDGIDSLADAKAPIGAAKISGKWRVQDGKLTEDVNIEGNMIVRKFISTNVGKSHGDFQNELIKLAQTPAAA